MSGRAVLNLFAATLSLALSLGVSELVTRTLRPDLIVGTNERAFFCSYDPRLGWRNRPGVHGTFFKTRVKHNAAGQRDKPRGVLRSGSGPRMMVLGDSFVWGYRVEARDRFTDRLEALMPGSEILNFGCSGYGQDQEYLLLQREIRRWQPDVVIVAVHVASDLENNMTSIQYGYHKPLFRIVRDKLVLTNVPVARDSLGSRVDKWMTARFALWNLVMNLSIGEIRVRTRFVGVVNALSFSRPVRAAHGNVSATEITCRLSAAMDGLAAATGAQSLFLLIPNVTVHDQSIQAAPDYDTLRGCLTSRGLAILDLAPVFRAYRAEHPDAAITLATDRHWSAEGNAVVSRTLHDYFQKHPPPIRTNARPALPR